MGNYGSLSDVSRTIVDLLKAEFSTENIVSPENIGFCEPGERGAFTVGLHIYDVRENSETRDTREITMPDGSTKSGPISMSMYMAVSIASKAEVAVRALDEQRILGKVIQTMKDNSRLPEKYMPDALRQTGEVFGVDLLSLEMEDKVKIWSLFNQPYRVSCFYRVGPIMIESAVIRKPAPKVKVFEADVRQEKR